MVDEERVVRLLERVSQDLGFLGDIGEQPARVLLADETSLSAIKYRFITAIEGCARIAHHLCVSEGWSAPDTNADAFKELGQRGVLAEVAAIAMARAAGFRNVLVHEYVEVDDRVVVDNLERLGDLRSFVAAIASWLGAP